MKITPMGANTSAPQSKGPTAAEKAIAAFNDPAKIAAAQQALAKNGLTSPAQSNTITEHPVTNANNISPEELSAIKAPSQPTEIIEESKEEETNTQELQTPEAKDPELERRFQQIARQERALRAKAQQQIKEFKAREQALAAKEQELTAKYQQPDLSEYISKAKLREDALGVLESEGLATYDELTQRAVSRVPVDPMVRSTIEKLEAKIAKLEADNQNSQKSYQEQQQAQYQAALKQIKNDAKQLVYTDPEFETVKSMNAVNDVVELIEQTYKKDGVVMTVEEAAKEVENYLIEEALKITQIDKIKKRMAQANASQKPTEAKPQPKQQTQMKTLTNATSSTRPLTARERAIAAAEGRLKS